jgi:uncharacterized RDD family membrane protein YckC
VSDLGSQTPYPSQGPPGAESQPSQFEQTIGGPSGPRAGFWRRFGAYFIDSLIIAVPAVIVTVAANQTAGNLVSVALALAYFTYFEGSSSGQTLGKQALGIRVFDFKGGGPIGYGRALLRTIARYLSAIVLLLGYLWMLWDREKQTWHDKIASTVVVPVDAYPVQ